jgi:flagellar protein FlgJ
MQIQQVPRSFGAEPVSISPPSDILLGVAKAADPKKYRQAVEKLARASGSTAVEAETALTAAIGDAATASSMPARATRVASAEPAAGRIASAFRLDQVAKAKKDPGKDFEAFFLQTAIESMLPKDSKALFGTGPAGDIWKSMLAEHIAKELAQSTSFGIAEQIAKHTKNKKEEAERGGPKPAAGLGREDEASGAAGASRISELRRLMSAEGQLALSAAQAAANASTGTG